MLRRQLAPQFVQKDENGKPNGFDTEGLYNAMLAGGADPMSIQAMRMKQVEMQKALLGLSDAQLEHQEKFNSFAAGHLESVRDANDKALEKQAGGATVTPPAPAAALGGPTASSMGPPVPGTNGMPAGMLPNDPAAQKLMQQPAVAPAGASPVPAPEIGGAPAGTPVSMGVPEPGAAPTGTETALQQASKAPKPMTPEGQAAYQRFLMDAARAGYPIQGLKANLTDTSDLDQAEAALGLHAELLKQQKAQADLVEAQNKGAQAKAEAAKANIISVPEMGGAYHVDEGVFKPYGGGATMSGAQMESKYVMDQAAKQRTGKSPDPQFDAGYERMKTIAPQFNINMAAGGAGMIPGGGALGATAGSGGPASSGAAPTINDVPAQIRPKVAQIVDYRAQLPPSGRNNPVNNAVNYWVNTIDPKHDDTFFPARNALMTKYTSGPEATQINAVNTALGHIGVLNDSIDALQNHDTKALNAIGNRLGIEFGTNAGDQAAMFKTIVHRVGPELASAYIQGGGGEGERGTTAGDFDASLAPKILHDNAAITGTLLRSKINSLQNQYQNTMQRDDFTQRFITPDAQKTLQTLSIQKRGVGSANGHVIAIGEKKYQYKGSGDTADLANYDEVKQ